MNKKKYGNGKMQLPNHNRDIDRLKTGFVFAKYTGGFLSNFPFVCICGLILWSGIKKNCCLKNVNACNITEKIKNLDHIKSIKNTFSNLLLVENPFALITASMWCGIDAISLGHCLRVVEAQISLMLAILSFWVILLLIVPYRFSMGFCEPT